MSAPRSGSRRPSAGEPGGRPGAGQWPMPERSAIAAVLGVPPLAAVGLALLLTALGVFIDILRVGTLGWIFSVLFFVGCVLAIVWVRRRSMFAAVVQPPLLLVVVVSVVVLLVATPASGVAETVLLVGAPLVNGFPTLAVTTGAVLVVAVVRLVTQRISPGGGLRRLRDLDSDEGAAAGMDEPDDDAGDGERARPGVSARRGSAAARGAARSSASPRRS